MGCEYDAGRWVAGVVVQLAMKPYGSKPRKGLSRFHNCPCCRMFLQPSKGAERARVRAEIRRQMLLASPSSDEPGPVPSEARGGTGDWL